MTDRLLQSPCFRTASAKRRREADSSSVATACQDLLDVQDHERTELFAKVDLGEGETGLHAIRQAATKADGEKPFDLFHETNSLGVSGGYHAVSTGRQRQPFDGSGADR